MASGQDVGNARRDVDNARQRHYHAIMHRISWKL